MAPLRGAAWPHPGACSVLAAAGGPRPSAAAPAPERASHDGREERTALPWRLSLLNCPVIYLAADQSFHWLL